MPQVQFEMNFAIAADDQESFVEEVKEIFSTVMSTGKDRIGISFCHFRQQDLTFGALSGDSCVVFVNADIRKGCSSDQKRRLSLALSEEIHRRWQVPKRNMCVILTEHSGDDFELAS